MSDDDAPSLPLRACTSGWDQPGRMLLAVACVSPVACSMTASVPAPARCAWHHPRLPAPARLSATPATICARLPLNPAYAARRDHNCTPIGRSTAARNGWPARVGAGPDGGAASPLPSRLSSSCLCALHRPRRLLVLAAARAVSSTLSARPEPRPVLCAASVVATPHCCAAYAPRYRPRAAGGA